MGTRAVLLLLLFSFFAVLVSFDMKMVVDVGFDKKMSRCFELNPSGVRLFHPAFPNKIVCPLSPEEVIEVANMKATVLPSHISTYEKEYQRLPWQILPRIGLAEGRSLLSKVAIEQCYDKTRHMGEVVW
jgi:hypothetical protein